MDYVDDPRFIYTNVTDIFSNCTLQGNTSDDIYAFLECSMGKSHIEMDKLIPITVIYTVIFICGLLGNIAICVVIVRNNTMHTATNFYLFSLAVSDLTLLLFGLPNDLNSYWRQYPWTLGEGFCKARAMVAEMTNYASVLTIVAFSLERYLAICHPLFAYTMAGLGRAVKIIALVWVTSFFCSVPFAVYSTINYRPYPRSEEDIPESAFCAMLDAPTYLYEISTIVFFILPMGILSILYSLMGLKLRRTSVLGREFSNSVHKGNNGESRSNASKRNMTRMLTAVVVGFFVCWAPFHAQRLLYLYGYGVMEYRLFQIINERLFYIAGCFYFMSAVINPILYNLMSERYRNAFKETVCGEKKNRWDRRYRGAILEHGHSSTHPSTNSSISWKRDRSISICAPRLNSNPEISVVSPSQSFVWRVIKRNCSEKRENPAVKGSDIILVTNPLLEKPTIDALDALAPSKRNGVNRSANNTLPAGCNPSCLPSQGVEPDPSYPTLGGERCHPKPQDSSSSSSSEESIEVLAKRASFSGIPLIKGKDETTV